MKRKLFHILNQRSRREEQERAMRELDRMLDQDSDPRRDNWDNDTTRICPLIEEE